MADIILEIDLDDLAWVSTVIQFFRYKDHREERLSLLKYMDRFEVGMTEEAFMRKLERLTSVIDVATGDTLDHRGTLLFKPSSPPPDMRELA